MPISTIGTAGLEAAGVSQAKLATGVAGTGPAFSAYQSTAQTFSTGTNTKILFQTEEFDTNNNFASSRFTPTVAGYYQITTSLSIPSASRTNEIGLYIYKNGALHRTGFDLTATIYIAQTGCLVYCNGSTDYIEIYVYTATGGTNTAAQEYTWFQASMVRSA